MCKFVKILSPIYRDNLAETYLSTTKTVFTISNNTASKRQTVSMRQLELNEHISDTHRVFSLVERTAHVGNSLTVYSCPDICVLTCQAFYSRLLLAASVIN